MKPSIRRHQFLSTTLIFSLISCLMSAYGTADDKRESSPPIAEIPFQLYNDNLIVIKGSIGPITGVNLILDTGTTPSAISNELAQRLNLHGSQETLQALNATVQTQSFILPSIQVGPVSANNIRVVVHDLGQLEHSLGITLGGIVGLDLLTTHSFTIDYRKKKIIFGVAAPARNTVRFEAQAPLLTVKATIGGQPVRLILDSGTPGLVVFRNRIATGTFRLIREDSIATVGGTAAAESFHTWVALGKYVVGLRTASIANVDLDSHAGFDGLLGFAAMGFRRVSFDFENGLFGWDCRSSEKSIAATSSLDDELESIQKGDQAASSSILPVITCGKGFHGNDCQSAVDAIALVLTQLKAQLPGWRVIVIPAEQWPIVVTDVGAKRSAPAFSNLVTRSTYLNDALIFAHAGTETALRAVTSLTGMPRLKWVLAHEYGHIVCHTRDEEKAERAAGHLQYGDQNRCD